MKNNISYKLVNKKINYKIKNVINAVMNQSRIENMAINGTKSGIMPLHKKS